MNRYLRKPRHAGPQPAVLNKHTADAARIEAGVYIGRPSKWGNPFFIGMHGNRAEVVAKYEEYIRAHPTLMEAAKTELRGRDLVCFCAPNACHGDVLWRIANKEY